MHFFPKGFSLHLGLPLAFLSLHFPPGIIIFQTHPLFIGPQLCLSVLWYYLVRMYITIFSLPFYDIHAGQENGSLCVSRVLSCWLNILFADVMLIITGLNDTMNSICCSLCSYWIRLRRYQVSVMSIRIHSAYSPVRFWVLKLIQLAKVDGTPSPFNSCSHRAWLRHIVISQLHTMLPSIWTVIMTRFTWM